MFNGAGYAAAFDCESTTIGPGNAINVDLDTGACHGGEATDSDEIYIVNVAAYGNYVSIQIGMYNGASATASDEDSGNWAISSDSSAYNHL